MSRRELLDQVTSHALAAICAYLTRNSMAVVNTTIQAELDIGNLEMGKVLSAFSVGYLICQILGGWFGKRFGARMVLTLLCVLWSCCAIWMSLVESYSMLRLSRFCLGLVQAGIFPVSALVITYWFPLRQRGMASAILASSMSVGSVIAAGLTAELLEPLGWRETFRLYAYLGLVWSVTFLGGSGTGLPNTVKRTTRSKT